MEIISAALMAVFLVASVYLTWKLVSSILGSMQLGNRFRTSLREKIGSQPLSRMLSAHGVEQDRFVASVPVAKISRYIKRCEGCDEKAQCAEDLVNAVQTPGQSYCPNHQDLTELAGEFKPVREAA